MCRGEISIASKNPVGLPERGGFFFERKKEKKKKRKMKKKMVPDDKFKLICIMYGGC